MRTLILMQWDWKKDRRFAFSAGRFFPNRLGRVALATGVTGTPSTCWAYC